MIKKTYYSVLICVFVSCFVFAHQRVSIWERDWDDNERQRDERFQIQRALDMLDIKPGMSVGEVGGGFGYLVFKLADRVGPSGIVYNEDIWEDALKLCQQRMAEKGYTNIEIILGTTEDCKFPNNSLDYVFICATMRFLEKPIELFKNIVPSLKQGGKLVIIEQEEGRAVGTNGDVVPAGFYRTKQEYLDLFSKTVFKVDKVDETLLPHDLIFILSVKNHPDVDAL